MNIPLVLFFFFSVSTINLCIRCVKDNKTIYLYTSDNSSFFFIAYRRLSESQFKHSLSRDADIFSKQDSASTSNPGMPNSPGLRSTPSRESVFEIGSNTLPRGKRV